MTDELHRAMTTRLTKHATQLVAAEFDLTAEVELYVEAGLPLPEALASLNWSRSTYYRRLSELRAARLQEEEAQQFWDYSEVLEDEEHGAPQHEV
jgi:glucose-6-phosphate dehydrogenase assembly protein OpcA